MAIHSSILAWRIPWREEPGRLQSMGLQRVSHDWETEHIISIRAYQVALVVKNPPAKAGDVRNVGLIPGSGRSPGGGHGNTFQYSCLENAMDRGVWSAIVLGVAKIGNDWSDLACMHACIANLQIWKFPFGSLYTSWKHLSCFTDIRLSEALQNYVLHFYGHVLHP